MNTLVNNQKMLELMLNAAYDGQISDHRMPLPVIMPLMTSYSMIQASGPQQN